MYNCIKNNGTLSDIENVCSKHFAAYLNISFGMSLKQYIDNVSNSVETATDVNKHIVYVNYNNSEYVYI